MGWTVIHLCVKKGQHMPEKNDIATVGDVKLTSGQQFQVQLLAELEKSTQSMGTEFSDYGKKCVVNSIAGLVTVCKNNKISLAELDPVLLRLQLQNIGFTELNYASIPAEVFIDLRKTTIKDKDGNEKETYTVAIKPQGAGNEKLVRKFGVNIKELLPAWLVREGDEFTLGSFDGIKQTPPTWVRKSLDKKVIMVVYPVIKTNGDVEYLMASRDSVKANLIAQIRQNSMNAFKKDVTYNGKTYKKNDTEARDQFYAQVEKDFDGKSLDEILALPEYAEYINPTYTSGGSKEQMILRKMRNNALKNYPREYDTSLIKDAVQNMFEDTDETVKEPAKVVKQDVVDAVEFEIAQTPATADAPKDFEVDDNGVVITPTENQEPQVEETKEKEEQKNSSENYEEMF